MHGVIVCHFCRLRSTHRLAVAWARTSDGRTVGVCRAHG